MSFPSAIRTAAPDGTELLTIENGLVRRVWRFNGGLLATLRVEDIVRGTAAVSDGARPDIVLPGLTDQTPVRASFASAPVEESPTVPAHLRAEVVTEFPSGALRQVFRVFPGVPFIERTLYVRAGSPLAVSEVRAPDRAADEAGPGASESASGEPPVLDRLPLPGVHWTAETTDYADCTDRNNNLVVTRSARPFRFSLRLSGNVCLLTPRSAAFPHLVLLKLAPCGESQSDALGYDFLLCQDSVEVHGCGLSAESDTEWVRGYASALGVAGPSRLEKLLELRRYQKCLRRLLPGRDEMVLMNTWGDRARDAHLCEEFALRELERGKRLGISHFQLDDGWQKGLSHNSAFGGEWPDIAKVPDYWTPNPVRFPNGLGPVVRRARELGIELCLWFNPSSADRYASWRRDADVLVGLYREHGIRTFKIDGLRISDALCRNRVRALFDAVREATGDRAVFNMDVTADVRFGYHDFTEYGNVFVENRYTDWTNHYPFWTLRNLWQLSATVPPERLQIEFLNPFRNIGKYAPDDDLAPSRIPFETSVAMTLPAQPLAWLESTGLPDSPAVDRVSRLLAVYRDVQHDFHSGAVLPIGFEPDGDAPTGFLSIRLPDGASAPAPRYLLLFSESRAGEFRLPSPLPPSRSFSGTDLLTGETVALSSDTDSRLLFSAPAPWSFRFLRISCS